MKDKPNLKVVINWNRIFTVLFRYLWLYLIFPCIMFLVVKNYIGNVDIPTFIAVFGTLFLSSMIGLLTNIPRKAVEVDKKKKK